VSAGEAAVSCVCFSAFVFGRWRTVAAVDYIKDRRQDQLALSQRSEVKKASRKEESVGRRGSRQAV